MDSDIWVRVHRKRHLFLDHFRSQQGGSFISLSKIRGVKWRQPGLCIANVPFNLPLSTFHTVVLSTDSVAWISYFIQFSSVQFSCVWLFVTPWTAEHQASLSITNSRSLLKLMSIESVMPSNHFILCLPLLLPPSIFPSIMVFSNESVLCIRWPKYWSFSFSISPSKEYSGLISFRMMDWLDLLAVQGTQESSPIPQFKSINSLASAFFVVQLSHPYMTTGKTIGPLLAK